MYMHRIGQEPCALHSCQGCPFGGAKVSTRGPLDSPFVIVGESPGSSEVIKKAPFVGASGQMLDQIFEGLAKKGYDIPEPFITNAMQCYPNPKLKDPKKLADASSRCHGRLAQELSAYPRKVILCLGNAAMWSVVGDYKMKVTANRGTIYQTPYSELGAVVAVHPAFLMRGGGSLPQFKSDLEKAIILLNNGAVQTASVGDYEVINDLGAFESFVDMMLSEERTSGTDVETTGFDPFRDKIFQIGFSITGKHQYILERELLLGTNQFRKGSLLDKLMTSKKIRFVWHNGKFDCRFFRAAGIDARVDSDTMLQSYTLDETKGIHGLEDCAADRLGLPNWKDALQAYLRPGMNYSHIQRDVMHKYLSMDAGATFQLDANMMPLVDKDVHLSKLYHRLLIPASETLLNVELNGFQVDQEQVEKNAIALQAQKEEPMRVIQQYATQYIGAPININSWQQLQVLLYDKLRLAPSGTATDADTLETLPDHPVVKALLSYRKIHKLYSTYVVPLTDHFDSKGHRVPSIVGPDGRIHSTYKLHGTATGRLASSDPNMQNIPRGTIVRAQFVASPGNVLIEVDLNQAELRCLAILSGDPELCRIYNTAGGPGLHEELRRDLYGMAADWTPTDIERAKYKWRIEDLSEKDTIERILEEQKMRAKNVNFGIPYGISAPGLADQIDDTKTEAQRLLDAWARKFPVARKFIDQCRQTPITQQTIITTFGRKKRWHVVSREKLNDLQNQAANFPHQSIASDIVLESANELEKPFREEYGVKIVNVVHDSAIMDSPPAPEIVDTISLCMIEKFRTVGIRRGLQKVPFLGEAKIGYRWSELQKYKPSKDNYHLRHEEPLFGIQAYANSGNVG